MAGELQRSSHRNFFKLTLSNGIPVVCAFHRGNPLGADLCVECGCVPEEFFPLGCMHIICEPCYFDAGREYVCKVDELPTVIEKGVDQFLPLEIDYRKVILVCPVCNEAQTYGNIKEHIEMTHLEWVKKEHSLSKKQPQHDLSNHELCRKQFEELRDEIRLLKEDNRDLQTALQELRSDEKNHENMAKLERELKTANAHRTELKELIQEQAAKLQEAENCIRKLKDELHMDRLLPVFEHVWKLQPYSALRKSLLFNNATLSTGVLSVNTPGYKIELMISIKGNYREWRRQLLKDESSCAVPAPHLDAMFRIHQGEDDDLLAWPFTNKMSLCLVNHLDKDKSKLLELGSGDGEADWLKKPKRGALNPLFGFPRVISLVELENADAGFLFQDCIVFKFTVHRRE